MNEFDRLLETQLRRMLDPVVAIKPPVRGRRQKAPEPILPLEPPDLLPAIETIPVTPLPQL